MKLKPALVGIGLLLIVFAAIGWYLYNKPHTGVSNVDPDVQITAKELYNDFQQNEASANQKYLNKVIEVTGSISDNQNIDGSQIILLNSGDAAGGISCKLSNDDRHKNVAGKSITVTIKGKCSGYLMDVNLVDCIVK